MQAHGRGPQGEFEAQYHYDALGRRSRKAVRYKGKTEQTTRFLWQGYRLLQEQRDDGSRRSWSYDPASPWSPLAALEQAGDSRSADIYWYHTDLNSAPLEVTDAAGNLCWSGQYDTFGKLQGQTVAGAAKRQGAQYQQPLRYAGQYQDDESGLHYNLFRYYEPEVGRFTTQDPIGLEGGLNLYQYAPNPLMWVDPFGLSNFFTPVVFNAPSGSTHTVYQQEIDWDLPVNTRNGVKTNLDLALDGKSPFVVKNGKYSQINLHHSKQNGLGSLFELSADTHQKYYGTNALHPHLPNQHPINPVNRDAFNGDRDSYWRQRGENELRKRNLKSNCRG